MAINLDEIVAGSNNMDELMAAIEGESASNAKAAGQILQLTQAAQGSMSPLDWLKSKVSPGSTAGTLANEAEFKKYQIDTIGNGETPMSREEFNIKLQEHRTKLQQRGGKA